MPRKKQEVATEESTAEVKVEAAPKTEAAEEKPAPKKRGRKPKAAAEKEPAATAEALPKAAESEPAEEKPAPKKRGRKPKAAAEKEAEPQKAEAAEPAEEKPAPKRRGRKPKAAAEKAAEPAEEKSSEAAEQVQTPAAVKPAEETQAQEVQAEPVKEKTADEMSVEKTEEKASEEKPAVKRPATRRRAAVKPEPEKAETQEEPQEEVQDPNRPEVKGILDIAEGGFGFLRFDNFLTSDRDVYVSPTQIRRFRLKTGDEILGISRLPNAGERFGALLYVKKVNGDDPGVAIKRPQFEDLTPIFPNERITLEIGENGLSTRLIDLIAPIGKGQRGLIVAPPKAGKTILLKNIARSIEMGYPDIEMIVLLVDERPEEVTDMKRSLMRSSVIYSTFDEMPQHHVRVAEMVLARAQRLAEQGKDVVILLDSLTRLTRAYNLVIPPSGRTLSGGMDPGAFYGPKRFFGAARNIEEGGSITIMATALIDTGSRMDDVVYEEFKGTGNMELHLDRKLSEKRIFPAIDIYKSGTRREENLLSNDELEAIWALRRAMSAKPSQEVTEQVISALAHTARNSDFVQVIKKVFNEE
ncbi:MAG: transcription termination factor Rho [Eubacterium sp.]|nr:transcription termination factor Rho [Eubacterium sp.]